jgi:RNA polymerase sigma-70 factor, ECF subfamily
VSRGPTAPESDEVLLDRVLQRDAAAWQALIERYATRLTAFAARRLGDPSAADDVVQETFLGLLLALPNYRPDAPFEPFLFSIAAHKLTDALRRRGIRPRLFDISIEAGNQGAEPALRSRERQASSLARSGEQNRAREQVMARCLSQLIQQWISRGEFERLRVVELLFVLGWTNQRVAQELQLSEQAVANHKSFVLQKLKLAAAEARLRDVDRWLGD